MAGWMKRESSPRDEGFASAHEPASFAQGAPPSNGAPPDTRTSPAPGRAPLKPPRNAPAATPGKDSGFREIVETVVFVVVLVLLLKTFTAEAFVIPTGSMATTLWGDQKWAVCPECGYGFPVNCHDEVEGRNGQAPVPVTGCTCPNCRFGFDFRPATRGGSTCNSGDRVLVAKYLYDIGVQKPQRLDVVVFKFPREPQRNESPTNYIKRLVGLPGEWIGIWYGKLYVMAAGPSPAHDDSDIPAKDRWGGIGPHSPGPERVMHEGELNDALRNGDARFAIIRKPPDKILALRRIVYDNDHPARDLDERKYARWLPESEKAWWAQDRGFRHDGDGKLSWLRYRHVLRPFNVPFEREQGEPRPELITDFIGYNSRSLRENDHPAPPRNWVGDLILECDVLVEQPQGEFVLELSKGVDRFQAKWELATGICTLTRATSKGEEVLRQQETALKQPGNHHLRFANVDERLVVWVDGKLPFSNGVEYPPPAQRGPTANDLQPASVGARQSAVVVRGLRLWRDTYYTLHPPQPDALPEPDWSNPASWGPLQELPAKTLYVQAEPRHYLCLGDNSPESSDGRDWGLVPERLLLGRALFVYWPCYFPWWPFSNPVNRVGPIR